MITVLGNEDERGTEPLHLCPRCNTEQMVLKKTKDGRYADVVKISIQILMADVHVVTANIYSDFPSFVIKPSV